MGCLVRRRRTARPWLAGLHAVDVARIEAGLVIPGSDYTPAAIDPGGDAIPVLVENRTTPLGLSMHRFVDFEKGSDFIGRAALLQEREQGSKRKMVGIEIDWSAVAALYTDAALPPEVTPQVIRLTLRVLRDGAHIGRTTSVTWSPTVNKVIGFAHVQPGVAHAGTEATVDWDVGDVRGEVPATLVDLPHYGLRELLEPQYP